MSELTQSPVGWKIKALHVLRLVIATIGRFFFSLYYKNASVKLPPIKDEILKLPAVEVARRIRTKKITSVEVLETCIRRIKDVNTALNCFVEDRFELAMKEAKEADELVRSGSLTVEQLQKEKPFLGVPFTTKDAIGVKGIHLTAGLVARKDIICEQDADVIKLLREKGAIIIGLTCVPELCMWWESHNHLHGRAKNPYDTTRTPGGSSGGEGSLQAAAGSIFGIGSDIGGSIRMPAFFNGIFGHKPSRHTVPNGGQLPAIDNELLNSFLGVGPMTRHAVDLKPILEVLAGERKNVLNLDKPVEINKLKVFYQISNDAYLTDNVDPDIKNAMNKVIEYFNKQHKLEAKKVKIDRLKDSMTLWFATMKTDVSFGTFLMNNYSTVNVLIELFKNIIGYSAHTIVALFTALFDLGDVEYGGEKYKAYLKMREDLEEEFKEMLGDNGVFLYPTHPTPAPYHNETLLKYSNFSYTAIINCLGFPATHIPLGLSREGLPIGIQVVANVNNDRLCLAVAEALDKAFGGWREP